MAYDQWNDKVRELDARLTLQILQLDDSLADRRNAVARWSPLILKAGGVAAGVIAIRVGPLRFLSMGLAVSRVWRRVLAFRGK